MQTNDTEASGPPAEHTADLDHLLAEALHTADVVRFNVLERAEDRTPARYRVNVFVATYGFVTVEDADRVVALAEAMRQLKIAIGGFRPGEIVQAKHLSCQGLQMVDPDKPIHGGLPVEGFHEELKRRGEGHVYGCEVLGCSGATGGTR